MTHFLKLLHQAVVVGAYFIFFEEFIELPQQNRTHFLPSNLARICVNEHALGLIRSQFEMTYEAGAGTRRNAGFGGDKRTSKQFICILPPKMLNLEVPSVYLARVTGFASYLCDQVILHCVVHDADHIGGRGMVRLLLKAVRVHELAVLQF